MDVYEQSLEAHKKNRGKIEVHSRMRLDSKEDLSLAYTPGVARPCEEIARDPACAWDLTWKGRTVAVVTDGSAVLGLGNIGPMASLPVMEGKAALFKEFAGIDAVPVVLDTQDSAEVVRIVQAIAPTYGGINLEDISAPRCFQIEDELQDIGIPVMHDDQHGTAIVLLAAMKNACRVIGRPLEKCKVVISGAGAAGSAIAKLLGHEDGKTSSSSVESLLLCDSRGVLFPGRAGNNPSKEEVARLTNPGGRQGTLKEAMAGANVFIGVSRANLLDAGDIRRMDADPIIFAMANPTPEIDPKEARQGGAAIVGTGRSDFPNQVNNVLAFPGLFRGALEARAVRFNKVMFQAAVDALVDCVRDPGPLRILPPAFDRSVAVKVARQVAEAARRSGACVGPACAPAETSPSGAPA